MKPPNKLLTAIYWKKVFLLHLPGGLVILRGHTDRYLRGVALSRKTPPTHLQGILHFFNPSQRLGVLGLLRYALFSRIIFKTINAFPYCIYPTMSSAHRTTQKSHKNGQFCPPGGQVKNFSDNKTEMIFSIRKISSLFLFLRNIETPT